MRVTATHPALLEISTTKPPRCDEINPPFELDRLKAEKLIDSKVLEQGCVQMDAGCSGP